ncbi:TonB-dependent receptor plug domain-containing protein [Flavobacterium sedimenticola]|uniref:TonB-dependent receptor n=1 Tax=Flavobacterium sedimenticola TaxID=3043286 RepID=A0ABT6XP84_9FLAO|nr:TonB-dependent receptor [Flavobacterium sedimenticola]MDI9256652.1 TonB-dependent receptor [Flavobacterium sedimenticola]
MKKTIRAVAALALLNTCAYAQVSDSTQVNALQEVVVSDTKFAQRKEKSGKIIEVISAQELEKKSGQSLATVLSQVTGVEINGNQSANGKNLGYYIRGGKNRQVLVLIDGIPVTDASGISLEYDLRLLPIEQVERIEVMKGAASTLYGTGAATGVINITLKKSSQKAIEGNAYINIGSNNTTDNKKYNGQDFNQGISVNGSSKKANYLLGFNSSESGNISQIASPDNATDYEEDIFSRQNLIGKFGYKMSSKTAVDFFANYDRIKNNYDLPFDNTGFNDTGVNTTTSEQFRFGISPKYKYNKGEFVLNSGFTKIKRDYRELNTFTTESDYSVYESRSVVADAFNKYNINKQLAVIVGTNYQFHDMLSQTPYGNIDRDAVKFNILDGYTTLVYHFDFGLNINTGARLNHHSAYGNNFVYNFNPSYTVKAGFPLKLVASYSTAYITPSLYQLYSEYGNADLTPEKNATAEAGLEAAFFDKKVKFDAVAFYRDQTNSFDFYFDPNTFEAYYINVSGKHKAKGVETEVAYDVTSKLRLNANYTFTQVDEALNRLIPKHKANAGIDYQPTPRTLFNLSYQYFDARNDAYFDGNTFTTTTVTLGSYQLVNALVKYELIPNRLTLFGSATNIFNEAFIENVGYNTRGRNFRIGMNIVL